MLLSYRIFCKQKIEGKMASKKNVRLFYFKISEFLNFGLKFQDF